MANTNAAATGWPATASDNNVLFNAAPANLCQWLGSAAGNNKTLGGWQAVQPGGSGGDANAISADPGFASPSNLHITSSSAAANLGIPFGGIATDIDGNSRSAVRPDSGADEVASADLSNLTLTAGALVAHGSILLPRVTRLRACRMVPPARRLLQPCWIRTRL